MNEKVFYRYVRHPFNYSKLIGTLCIIARGDDALLGYSRCHPKDNFNKDEGRRLAYARANANQEWKDEVPIKSCNPDGSKENLLPMARNMLKFATDMGVLRCSKIF